MNTQLSTPLLYGRPKTAGAKNVKAQAQPKPQVAFTGWSDRFSRSPVAPGDQAYKIPKQLQKQIKSAATVLYGKDQAAAVSKQIMSIIRQAHQNRPAELLKEDYERPSDW